LAISKTIKTVLKGAYNRESQFFPNDIDTYAKPGVNCLLCEQGAFELMFFALRHLLSDPEARDSLAA